MPPCDSILNLHQSASANIIAYNISKLKNSDVPMNSFVQPSPLRFNGNVSIKRMQSCNSRPHRTPSRKAFTMQLKDVLIVGANRGLGFHIASLLHDRSTPRLVATYRENSFCPPTLPAICTAVHHLDAMDRETAHSLITNVAPEVVISCIGGSVSDDYYPDFKGNQNLIDAAVEASVKRFVLISALGAGNSEDSVPFQVMHTMRPLLLEKSHAETYLRASEIDWTIARPGPIVDEEETGGAVATEETNCYGTITRHDLAKVVVAAAQSDKAAKKILHMVDSKKILITSPYVRPLEFWEQLPFSEFKF